MKNYISKFKSFEIIKTSSWYEKEASEKLAQIHPQRESPDSSGSFGLKRTGKINSTII